MRDGHVTKKFLEFPAPLEVDRELYFIFTNILPDYEEIEFPAPREVDR